MRGEQDPPVVAADRPHVRSGFSFAAGSFVLSAGLGLLSALATSRLYGVNVIGEYALASTPYLVVSQISQVNEGTAFVRKAAMLPARGGRVSALFRVILGFSMALTTTMAALVMLVATLLLRGPIDRPDLVAPAVVILLAYVFIDNFNWNIDSVLSAFRAGHFLFWARTAQMASFLLAGVALASVTRSVWGLVAATAISFAVPLFVRIAAVRRYVTWRLPPGAGRAALREFPEMLRFGVVLIPPMLAGAITAQAGVWVVGARESVAMVGAYGRAYGLATRLHEAAYRIGEILMPAMVERRATGDVVGVARLLDRTFRFTAFPLIALSAGAAGAATGVMEVFGSGFDRGASALALLLAAAVLWVLSYILDMGFLAIGKPQQLRRQGLLGSALVLALMLPFEVGFGAAGVAGAYVLVRLLFLFRRDRLIARELLGGGALIGPRTLSRLGAVAAVGYLSARGMDGVSSSMVATGGAIGLGVCLSILTGIALGLVSPTEREELRSAVSRRLGRL